MPFDDAPFVRREFVGALVGCLALVPCPQPLFDGHNAPDFLRPLQPEPVDPVKLFQRSARETLHEPPVEVFSILAQKKRLSLSAFGAYGVGCGVGCGGAFVIVIIAARIASLLADDTRGDAFPRMRRSAMT